MKLNPPPGIPRCIGEAESAAYVDAPQVHEEPSELDAYPQGFVVPVGGRRGDGVVAPVARLRLLHHAGVVARGHGEGEVVLIGASLLCLGRGAGQQQDGGQHG